MRTVCNIFGVLFLIIGAVGFVPWATSEGRLLGVFEARIINNLIYIATGLAALWAGSLSAHAARSFFRLFGAIYLGFAIIGFMMTGEYILGIMAHTRADNWLHLVLGVLALFFGFAPQRLAVHGTTPSSP